MKLLYYSLIHPYLQYGLMLWGSTYKKLLKKVEVLQKRAIRIICRANYNEHSTPLFKRLKIPNLDSLYKIQLGKFIFSAKNNLISSPLRNIFTLNHNVHMYATRQKDELHYQPIKNSIVHKSFLCKGPELWSGLPSEIKESNSLPSFASKLRKHLTSLLT